MSNHQYHQPQKTEGHFERYNEGKKPQYDNYNQSNSQGCYHAANSYNQIEPRVRRGPEITVNTSNPYLQNGHQNLNQQQPRQIISPTDQAQPPEFSQHPHYILKQVLAQNGRALAIARLTGTARICEDVHHDLDCLCGLKKALPHLDVDLTPSRKKITQKIIDIAVADSKVGCALEWEKSLWDGAIWRRESAGHFQGLISLGIPLYDNDLLDMEGRMLLSGTTKVGGDGSTKIWYFGLVLNWLPPPGTVPSPEYPLVSPLALCYGMEINPMTQRIAIHLLHAVHPNEFEPSIGIQFYTLTRTATLRSVDGRKDIELHDPKARLGFSVVWGTPLDTHEAHLQDCIETLLTHGELELIDHEIINGIRTLNVQVVRPLPLYAKRCSACGRWEALKPVQNWYPGSGFSRYHYRRWYECGCHRAWFCRKDCQYKFFKEQLEEIKHGGGNDTLHGYAYDCRSMSYYITCGEKEVAYEDSQTMVSPVDARAEIENVVDLSGGHLTEEAIKKFVERTGSNRLSDGWVLATTAGRTGSDDSLQVGLGGKQQPQEEENRPVQHEVQYSNMNQSEYANAGIPQYGYKDQTPPPVPRHHYEDHNPLPIPRHGYEDYNAPPIPPRHGYDDRNPRPVPRHIYEEYNPPANANRPRTRSNTVESRNDTDPTPEIPARYRVRKNTINKQIIGSPPRDGSFF